jgi:hypothetical protein
MLRAGPLDQRLVILQRAFAVVGQHQHLDAFEQLIDLRARARASVAKGSSKSIRSNCW